MAETVKSNIPQESAPASPGTRPLPLYFQVAETLKGRILDAQYKPGTRIPPARELADEFGVSNITIRKAIERLAKEGLVAPRQGVGTLVAELDRDRVEIKLTGSFRDWFDSASGRLAHLQTELVTLGTVSPPARIQGVLSHDPDQPFWCMVRRRRFETRPVSRFVNYFRLPATQRLTRKHAREESFIELYQTLTGAQFTHFTQTVEAVTADMDLATILEMDFGAPLFYVENIYYSAGDIPRAVTQMHYRGDSYLYKTTIPLKET